MRALLVEDEPICQKVTMALLNSLGFKTDMAATVAQAVDMAHYSSYDLIVSDIGLPDASGTDLAKLLRRTDRYKEIPIIALTAHLDYASEDEQDQAKSVFDKILFKPISVGKIRQAIFA